MLFTSYLNLYRMAELRIPSSCTWLGSLSICGFVKQQNYHLVKHFMHIYVYKSALNHLCRMLHSLTPDYNPQVVISQSLSKNH